MRIELFMLCIAASASVASCTSEDVITNRAEWPSCSWPASLDPDSSGSSREHCVAKRTQLSCELARGVTQLCTTNDPLRCEGADAPPPEACEALCGPGEFSATCGGVGPGAIPDPPAGCRYGSVVPAGFVYYCCPCG